jgi:hypothetical protein
MPRDVIYDIIYLASRDSVPVFEKGMSFEVAESQVSYVQVIRRIGYRKNERENHLQHFSVLKSIKNCLTGLFFYILCFGK